MQSQVKIVQSRDLARQAIKELKLVGNPEFDPLAGGGGSLGRVLVMLGLQRDPGQSSPEDRVLDTYFEKLTVLSPPKTRVLQIDFSANDPDMAAKGANTVARLYVETQSRVKRDSARQIAASLGGQIGDLKTRLAEAEAKAERFRLKSGLLLGANNLNINAQQLGDLNTQLAAAKTLQAESQAKARLIRDMVQKGRIADVPDVANNDLTRRVSEQLVTLKATMAQESRTLLPGHPRIKELAAQVADIENQLRAAAQKTVRTLENDARIAGSRVENLQATLDSQKKVVGAANADDVTLRQLDSEAKLLKDQLDSSMAKFQEAQAREGAVSTPSDARIYSSAIAPALPSFPKKVPILVSATLAGLVFSLGTVVAGELLSGRAAIGAQPYRAPVPVKAARLPIFARLRRSRAAPAAAVDAGPAPAAHEPVAPRLEPTLGLPAHADPDRDLLERIDAAGLSGQAVVTLVAGLHEDDIELAAARAIALARGLSRNHRAILVNMDPRGGEIELLTREDAPDGFAELLAGACSFAEAIHRDRLTRLHVLPHGAGEGVAGREGLDLVLDALCETYDHVLLALPALAAGGLAATIAPYADFAVLAAAAAAADAALEEGCELLRRAGAGEVLLVIGAPKAAEGRSNAA